MKTQTFTADDFRAIATLLNVACSDCDLPLIKEWTISAHPDGRVTHGDCGGAEAAMDEWPHWFRTEDKKK